MRRQSSAHRATANGMTGPLLRHLMPRPLRRAVAGALAGLLVATGIALAQHPPVHYYHQGVMPPGAIGRQQLTRGGPLPGHFQPVEIKAPLGAVIALAEGGQFGEPAAAPIRVGMLISPVYRMRLTGIPGHAGEEVFPTVEIIDRLYTPHGQEQRFAIPVEITQGDLELALAGKFVTRVIYVEDPEKALPVRTDAVTGQNWFEAGPGRDPLAIADQLGRPVAILRMGGRIPMDPQMPDPQFLGGCPAHTRIPPRMKVLRPPPRPRPENDPQAAETPSR